MKRSELAAGITSALKGEHDLAVGNVIGSNIFNLLSVLPVPALMAPGVFDSQALTRDIPVMLGLTLALFLVGYRPAGSGKINRWEGLLLLLAFIGYQSWLYLDATRAMAAAAT
jgi:cation:H+ antiporter